ncbi:MAG: redox-regulated ATPase YchF [Chloroflexi bacterium]|nr:redox-regulated ATPase YchF [Chloroflexota bacterium]
MHICLHGPEGRMKIGIIGIPRCGKTSLFNAVTRGSAVIGSYSTANEPNIGTVQVPDARLDALAEIYSPKKTTYAEIQWVDYPYAGISSSGIDQQLMQSLGELDVLVHVVRSFTEESVPHEYGSIDVDRDIGILELELQFSDLELIEKRIGRIESEMRSVKSVERSELERHQNLLEKMKLHLEKGFNLRTFELSEIESQEIKHYNFVTLIPELLVINIGEGQLGDIEEIINNIETKHASQDRAIVLICAKVEAELSTMSLGEALEFRSELGLIGDPPLNNAIAITYDMLGLHSFLTAGEDECRAWPIQKGLTAPQAAGKIHSDLERGFIRVEVASYEELLLAGSMAELKKRGQLRTEGKQYIVKDGDVMNVLFNV